MKKTDIDSLMGEYKNLERLSHVSTDDAINKVTQEVAELIEAHRDGDETEMYGEAGDVLVNIYSVAKELGMSLDLTSKKNDAENKNPIDLAILHGMWNDKIQTFRGRYSRKNISLGEAQKITEVLVKEVMKYAHPEMSISQVVQKNIDKFRSRTADYLPNIDIKDYIKSCPDFPKTGIDFKDISPILESPEVFRYVCIKLAEKCQNSDKIVALDARGFLFGSFVSEYLAKPFVMVRKKGKLPGKTISQDYGLEYGNDVIEMQEGSIKPGEKVSIIDDLLATGGTVKAAIDLVEKSGGVVDNVSFVISLDEEELVGLDSRKELGEYNVNSVVKYQ